MLKDCWKSVVKTSSVDKKSKGIQKRRKNVVKSVKDCWKSVVKTLKDFNVAPRNVEQVVVDGEESEKGHKDSGSAEEMPKVVSVVKVQQFAIGVLRKKTGCDVYVESFNVDTFVPLCRHKWPRRILMSIYLT